jgi:hypothetical protein
MRLAAEDAETDRILSEVRALLRPWGAASPSLQAGACP